MPTPLDEMNFELLPSPLATGGVVFGIGRDVSVDDEGFDPGEDNWTEEDAPNPRLGGVRHGRDTLDGAVWTWDLHANKHDTISAKKAVEEIRTAWRALSIRDTPGAVIPLRYRLGDETRRVYGRPRRFAAPPSNKILAGYVPITADFVCVDNYTYSDAENAVTMTMGAGGSGGGFTFPTVFPLATLPPSSALGAVTVGGTAPARPIITFVGPLTNPVLEHNDWRVSLTMTIPAGAEVVVDTRAWVMSATMGGASAAGSLDRRLRLEDVKLSPGPHSLRLFGSTSTSGTCTVRWLDTWNGI